MPPTWQAARRYASSGRPSGLLNKVADDAVS
jgi:hypothetical protein